MNNPSKTDPLEAAVHVIIVLIGVIILFVAYSFQDIFWQSLLVNVGSSLVVVTLLFAIFETFRRRHHEKSQFDNTQNTHDKTVRDIKANELIISLRASQQPPITSNNNKVSAIKTSRGK